ncbi:MAG TPA: hypothetical protein VMH80_23595 [Bryobacteraceae bacterium]|nr:hypothetical protein [Bryobacteraceae bacterium]
MRFEYELIPELPRLAWAARVRRNEPVVRVLHGAWVETRPDCFFEGAWDGPFEDGRFDEAETFAGSGGRVRDGEVVFAGPSHTFDRLFAIRTNDEFHIANSLAFVLAVSEERLDQNYKHYYLNFLDFNRDGIRHKEKRLRLAGTRFMEVHDCCNVVVQPGLTVSRAEKPLGTPPRGYDDYIAFVMKTLEAVLANARDPRRKQTYRPVTQMSRGYDSVAVSILAARAGCREAASFRKSNSARGYEDDGGREIAPYLGLQLTEYERTDYDMLAERHDDEFYIEPGGIDRQMVLMEKQLVGSIQLQGRYGERFWSREWCSRWGLPGEYGNPYLAVPTRHKIGGCGLGEFRLRTGFIDFPVSCIRGLHAPAIKRLSESKAMDPWSVGGDYDRPIVRRLAEEAGVPQHLFGQSKKGGPRAGGPEIRSWANRMIYAAWHATYWAPLRLLILKLTGHTLNPAWRQGSFGVQRRVERIREQYLAAIMHAASHSTRQTNLI